MNERVQELIAEIEQHYPGWKVVLQQIPAHETKKVEIVSTSPSLEELKEKYFASRKNIPAGSVQSQNLEKMKVPLNPEGNNQTRIETLPNGKSVITRNGEVVGFQG